MAEDRRTWTEVVEDDLYAEEQERFHQWLDEHPDPLDSLRREVETLRSVNERLEQVLSDLSQAHMVVHPPRPGMEMTSEEKEAFVKDLLHLSNLLQSSFSD